MNIFITFNRNEKCDLTILSDDKYSINGKTYKQFNVVYDTIGALYKYLKLKKYEKLTIKIEDVDNYNTNSIILAFIALGENLHLTDLYFFI